MRKLAVLCLLVCLFSTPLLAGTRPLPRVLVYLKGSHTDLVQGTVEEVLLAQNFKLKDRDQLRNIKEVDAALASGDKNKLLALKYRYGIEVILTGKVNWIFSNEREVYGRTYRYYRAHISMKAIVVDTAQVIYSKSLRFPSETSTTRVLVRLGKKLALLMAKKIRAFWAKAAFQNATFEVVVSKCDYTQLSALERYLKAGSKVLRFARRSFLKQTGIWDVVYKGNRVDLERYLLQCSSPSLKVVRTTANRIELEVGKAAPKPRDVVAPKVQILYPSSGTILKDKVVQVVGRAQDQGGIAKVLVNGKRATVLGKGPNFTASVALKEGKNTIRAVAYDKAGNSSQASVMVYSDQTAPQVSVLYPMDGSKLPRRKITVVVKAVDRNLSKVSINGVLAKKAKIKNTFSALLSFPKDGRYTIVAVGEDIAGNRSTASVKIQVDATPPKVSFKVWINGTVDKPGSRVWVNGVEVPVVEGKWKAQIDIMRVKKVVIIAVDPSGNRTVTVKKLGGN